MAWHTIQGKCARLNSMLVLALLCGGVARAENIETIAGNGTGAFAGDGGPAHAAQPRAGAFVWRDFRSSMSLLASLTVRSAVLATL